MSIEVQFLEGPGYLIVEVSGQWTTDEAKQQIEAIRGEANNRSLTRLFVDVRNLSQPGREITRFFTGEHIAKMWCPPFKTAVLTKPEMYTNYAEAVALNRYAIIAVFFEEEEALGWLLK